MKIFSENDSVTLTKQVIGEVIGEQREVTVPSGAVAAVVLVHGNKRVRYRLEWQARWLNNLDRRACQYGALRK